MGLLNPLAFLFALLAVPIILLYLLRLRRREQTVSSTLLWQQATMEREANTLWQRLRRNLLLILQLATLACLVFALVRPYVSLPGTVSGRSIVLLDASASMQATDVTPSRFEVARARVRDAINSLGANDQMMLIVVDGAPRALSALTGDKSQLLDALDSARPSLDAANWSAAVALAVSTGVGVEDTTVLVFSDGADADDLSVLPGRARFIPIGSSGENVAVSTLTLRRTLRGLSAFVRVTNYGTQEDRVLVSLRADGALVDARTLEVPAGASAEWTIANLDPNVVAVDARIDEAQRNFLGADDAAYAVNAANATRHALLLTRGNRFLEQALASLPGLRVTRAVTAPLDVQTYDLYVLDNVTATLPPFANALLVGAQAVFTTSGVFSNTAYARTEPHPVTRNVDWRSVNVLDARRVDAPSWLRPIIESEGGPLVLAGEDIQGNLGRIVLIPFDLRRSDLPLQIAFPILVANSVEWLAPPQGLNVPLNIKPGEVVPMPEGARVTLPSGEERVADRRGFAQTDQLGVYTFDTGRARGAFAVNFNNASESRIAPNPDLQVGSANASADPAAPPPLSQREFWHWMAAVALILLLVEWWIYQRGLPARTRRT
ncbi:MAG: VWA domain-containing protein [Thermoflexales bacterium]|nr:VWA domain-containing protein [Thermoflexales bacterium]